MPTIGTATNKKIIELFNLMKEGTLILQPSFQRKLVWNNKHKEGFIETILQGYPFPEVYFADGKIDLKTQKSQTLVVDGQQRLHTLHQYISNDPELVLRNIPRFVELDEGTQTNFFDYNVVVRDLGRLSLEDIKVIFNRINSVQYALNAIEINNALYEGEFIKTAKEIIGTNLLADLEVFGDSESSRMKDLEFITLIMATIETGGYFTSDNEVESFIKKYDDEYPNKAFMLESLTSVMSLIKSLELPSDTIWYRRSSLFSLLVETVNFKKRTERLPSKQDLEAMLLRLETEIIENKGKSKNENKYAKFYNYIFQGTAGRVGRIARGELLEENLDNL
ncbi:DUF262 domain-containing protein [Paenibacillus typhae]|uniref:GmrSD restriction endonucleases N-terminal domain-containing protein n=1 Tax=Paenibacillus typhae TaxID=1174501 RepID=A0A1G8Y2S5_9BACL|nr:DUF262 domain-containing protein [Paenibacillus typhae]SDJ96415.1 Protein of unknown function DUF262 [Paenibacillus typhae]